MAIITPNSQGTPAKKKMIGELPFWSLSPSTIRSYHNCPACLYLKKIKKDEPDYKFTHIAYKIGDAVHHAVEAARHSIQANAPFPPIEDLQAVARAAINHEMALSAKKKEEIRLDGTEYTVWQDVFPDLDKLVEHAFNKIVIPERALGISATEEKGNFNNRYPFKFTGIKDAQRGDGVITDLKTSHKVEEPNKHIKFQVTLYGAELVGKGLPARIEIAQLIKNPLGDLYYWATDIDEKHVEAADMLVFLTADAINSNIFPGRPSYGCHYKDCDKRGTPESEEFNAMFDNYFSQLPQWEPVVPHKDNVGTFTPTLTPEIALL